MTRQVMKMRMKSMNELVVISDPKALSRERSRRYYEANSEKIKMKRIKHYHANKDKYREYYKMNRERILNYEYEKRKRIEVDDNTSNNIMHLLSKRKTPITVSALKTYYKRSFGHSLDITSHALSRWLARNENIQTVELSRNKARIKYGYALKDSSLPKENLLEVVIE
jgi:hypothetical protein